MLRLGLCCKFAREQIAFRTTTATSLRRKSVGERLRYVNDLCLHNAEALRRAIEYCAANGIGAFRINSQIMPVRTHPEVGYDVDLLPGAADVVTRFRTCGELAARTGIRLSLHPDQFVLLSSPDTGVTQRSVDELRYQAEVAEWVGADVINIHGGGAYGDKATALTRVTERIRELPSAVRSRLTLENDDRVYTPADLLPVCREAGVPFVYDVHHHRCHPDAQSVQEATQQALRTWDREPLFHVSSPKDGWDGPKPTRHHDYIDPDDLPACWRELDITIDIEAKAKELAIRRLQRDLLSCGIAIATPPPDQA